MGVGLEYMREALALYKLQQTEDRRRISALEARVEEQAEEIRQCHNDKDQLRRDLAAAMRGRS